jgi:hypothetical protein
MTWIVTKYLITAAVVVLISEVAKRSDKLGGLVAALPMVTFLALIWLYVEKQPAERGCPEFCVNGHLAGNCRIDRRHHEQQETRRT